MKISQLIKEALFDPYGNVVSDAGGKVENKPRPSLITSPNEVHSEFKKIQQERNTPAKPVIKTQPKPTPKPAKPRERQHTFGNNKPYKVIDNKPSNTNDTAPSQSSTTSRFSRFKNWVSNHKVGVGVGAGATAAAAGGLATYLHHRNKSRGLSGFAKTHGKHIAAASLGAVGATMGIRALMKHFKKKKQ